MRLRPTLLLPVTLAVLAAGLHAAPLGAQEHEPAATGGSNPAAKAATDIITPHITDSYHLEVPYWKPPFATELCIGRHVGEHGCAPLWDDVATIHLGSTAMPVNLSPTKHVVMMLLAATLCALVMLMTAAAHARHHHEAGRPKGFAAGLEAMVLYLRNEVILPNLGHHGERYVPFCLTLFFFILFCNLLGLIPYGSTATGNISVTAMLAIVSFIMIEVAGMRALGAGYISTIVYWPHDMPVAMKLPMTIIMTPIEILSKFTKPFALAIRLFANMTAGHIVVLALIGLIFTFGSWAIAGAPLLMAVAIMMLELFVAFLQAFIFCLLTSVFIGQIREAHH